MYSHNAGVNFNFIGGQKLVKTGHIVCTTRGFEQVFPV